jgi:hypothetical protein
MLLLPSISDININNSPQFVASAIVLHPHIYEVKIKRRFDSALLLIIAGSYERELPRSSVSPSSCSQDILFRTFVPRSSPRRE